VVAVVDENLIIWTRFKHSAVSAHYILVFAFDDSQEVSGSDILAFVVNHATSVNIETWVNTCWLVINCAWDWIVWAVGNVVIRKDYDVLGWDAVVYQDVVGMANVRLMTVIVEAVGTGNKHGVLCAVARSDEQTQDD
jgi:hypothetical protein